jgi:hypothetical protein
MRSVSCPTPSARRAEGGSSRMLSASAAASRPAGVRLTTLLRRSLGWGLPGAKIWFVPCDLQ